MNPQVGKHEAVDRPSQERNRVRSPNGLSGEGRRRSNRIEAAFPAFVIEPVLVNEPPGFIPAVPQSSCPLAVQDRRDEPGGSFN